jgi:hypothetical protein
MPDSSMTPDHDALIASSISYCSIILIAVQAVITDKDVVVPLMDENIKANGLTDRP